MGTDSSPSARPPPGGSSPVLPAATILDVTLSNDSTTRSDGDGAAENHDGKNESERDGSAFPPQGLRAGKGSGSSCRRKGSENGRSDQDESLPQTSGANDHDDNNSNDGSGAAAKVLEHVASEMLYKAFNDGDEREGPYSLCSEGEDDDYEVAKNVGDDNAVGNMRTAGDCGEKEAEDNEYDPHLKRFLENVVAVELKGSSSEYPKGSVFDDTEKRPFSKDEEYVVEEEAEEHRGERRIYLPPAPEVDEDGGSKGISRKNGDHTHVHHDHEAKLEQGLDQSRAPPSPSGGLDQDEELLEKVPTMSPRLPDDNGFVPDGLPSNFLLVSKGLHQCPEIVAAPGPGDSALMQDVVAGRVFLESEGPRPEIVAAPGPNVDLARMAEFSARGIIRIDMGFPVRGQHNLGGGGAAAAAAIQTEFGTRLSTADDQLYTWCSCRSRAHVGYVRHGWPSRGRRQCLCNGHSVCC